MLTTKSIITIHVTHDRAEALAFADRLVVQGNGKIIQAATPKELLESPNSAEVASFNSDATVLPTEQWVLSQDDTILERGNGTYEGIVQSVLFERNGYSVTVRVDDLLYRAHTDRHCQVGRKLGCGSLGFCDG